MFLLIGEDDDDGDEESGVPSTFDYVMHYLTVLWKVTWSFQVFIGQFTVTSFAQNRSLGLSSFASPSEKLPHPAFNAGTFSSFLPCSQPLYPPLIQDQLKEKLHLERLLSVLQDLNHFLLEFPASEFIIWDSFVSFPPRFDFWVWPWECGPIFRSSWSISAPPFFGRDQVAGYSSITVKFNLSLFCFHTAQNQRWSYPSVKSVPD